MPSPIQQRIADLKSQLLRTEGDKHEAIQNELINLYEQETRRNEDEEISIIPPDDWTL